MYTFSKIKTMKFWSEYEVRYTYYSQKLKLQKFGL